ncbi:hypothetical protein MCOR25_002288 [Pyricularia grisea]|nr:hypothetical protein MCOR25_002288 [Pyricularia grisea]
MFSTASSYIYFPALVPMARDLDVSVSPINLTVTSYLVVAGIAPAVMGDFADQNGRRSAYMLMFTLVFCANIGLALQNSYPVLLVFRMLQSAGASGSYGASDGIITDITTTAERGSYVGSLVFFTNAAPSFGPVIAGVLTQQLGWRSIFWFLVILTGIYLAIVLLLLPETQRKIVGNGSMPTRGLHRSLFDALNRHSRQEEMAGIERRPAPVAKEKLRFPNPFKSLTMLFSKGNFSVIMAGSITYTVKMTLQSSFAAQCIDVYDLDYLQAGLIYLPSGIGGAAASFITGKLLDWNITRASAKRGHGDKYRKADDISNFPIQKVRLQGMYTLIGLSAGSTAAYGVALMQQKLSWNQTISLKASRTKSKERF